MTGLLSFLRPLRHPASSSIPQAVTLPIRGNDGRYSASPATIRQRRKQDEVTAELRRYVVERELVQAVERAICG